MTTDTAKLPEPGETMHFLVSGVTIQTATGFMQNVARVFRRGEELTITADVLKANSDRNGLLSPVLGLLHDPDGQRRRWDQQVVGAGPFPKHLVPTDLGSPEHDQARRDALRAAQAVEDPDERRRAVAEVAELYGSAQPTSRTVATYAGDQS